MIFTDIPRDVTNMDYDIQYGFSESTNNEVKLSGSEIFDCNLINWIRTGIHKNNFYQHDSTFIEIDLSSIWPRFEIKNETYTKESLKKELNDDMLEDDIVFYLPPKRIYNIKMNVKSIKKGVIRFVKSE